MRINADRDVCASSGMCALTLPEMFDQDEDDGRVVLLKAEPADGEEDKAREAVMLCPSGALSVVED